MDAEGLGRKLLLTPPPATPDNPCKGASEYCDIISQNANPASTFELSLSMQALQRGSAWAKERLWVPSGSLSPRTAASIYTL